MALPLLIICLSLCGLLLLAYLERRELREDNRKLINEFSVRTGGRLVFKPEPQETKNIPDGPRGEFAIITPSMAEADAMNQLEAEQNGHSELTPADIEHLIRTGVMK